MNSLGTLGSQPAFPLNELNERTGEICAQHFGLTLRDYFAAKAMAAILQSESYAVGVSQAAAARGEPMHVAAAATAYAWADAMLKERQS